MGGKETIMASMNIKTHACDLRVADIEEILKVTTVFISMVDHQVIGGTFSFPSTSHPIYLCPQLALPLLWFC